MIAGNYDSFADGRVQAASSVDHRRHQSHRSHTPAALSHGTSANRALKRADDLAVTIVDRSQRTVQRITSARTPEDDSSPTSGARLTRGAASDGGGAPRAHQRRAATPAAPLPAVGDATRPARGRSDRGTRNGALTAHGVVAAPNWRVRLCRVGGGARRCDP